MIPQRILILTGLCLLLRPGVSTAQPETDSLEPISRNKSLTRDEIAEIEGQVALRANRLADAATADIAKLAADTLIRPTTFADKSEAFTAAYADACSMHLAGMTVRGDVQKAVHAVLILLAIDHPNTIAAFGAALGSPHAAARYSAARGIEKLHPRLKDPVRLGAALRALGTAGAAEKDRLVLGQIYKALDCQDVPDFRNAGDVADAAADALAAALAARVEKIRDGSRDEFVDAPGLAAAAAVYSAAKVSRRIPVARAAARHLSLSVKRYYDPDTGQGSRQVLVGVIETCENALRQMIAVENVSAPARRVAALIKSNAAENDVREALADLVGNDAKRGVLNDPPWNLEVRR